MRLSSKARSTTVLGAWVTLEGFALQNRRVSQLGQIQVVAAISLSHAEQFTSLAWHCWELVPARHLW